MGGTGLASAMAPVRLWSGLCVSHAASAGLRASPAWSVLHSPGLGLLKDGDQWAASAWLRSRPAVAHRVPAARWPPCSVTRSSVALQARVAAGGHANSHPGQARRRGSGDTEGKGRASLQSQGSPRVSIRPEYPLERSGLHPTGPRVPELVDERSTGCSSKRGCRKTGLSAHLQ